MKTICLVMGVMLMLAASCAMSPVMSQQSFDTIAIGSSASQLKKMMGDPYEIERLDNGTEVYHYIERIDIGCNSTAQNTYSLVVSQGIVVDKKCAQSSPPLLQIRSP